MVCHGVLIGWDGHLIRHGISMVRSCIGNIDRTFFAPRGGTCHCIVVWNVSVAKC